MRLAPRLDPTAAANAVRWLAKIIRGEDALFITHAMGQLLCRVEKEEAGKLAGEVFRAMAKVEHMHPNDTRDALLIVAEFLQPERADILYDSLVDGPAPVLAAIVTRLNREKARSVVASAVRRLSEPPHQLHVLQNGVLIRGAAGRLDPVEAATACRAACLRLRELTEKETDLITFQESAITIAGLAAFLGPTAAAEVCAPVVR